MRAQEVLFAVTFAVALVGLAVYFVYLSAFVAWRRLTSLFLRIAVISGCTWFWSLCAAGFAEYCGASLRPAKHMHIELYSPELTGVLLFISLFTFIISLAALALGLAEFLLRGRRVI